MSPNGAVARHDLDRLDRPGAAGRALGDADHLVGQGDLGAVARSRSRRCRDRPRRTSGSTCRAAWKPSTSACWQSARTRVEAELGAGGADDPAGRLGQPDLLGQRLPLEGGDHGAAGLLGVRLEDPALRRVGRLPLTGRSMASVPRSAPSCVAQRRDQQVERVPGVGVVDRDDVGDPAPGLAGAGSRRSWGTKRSRPQSSAFSISVISCVDRGTPALELDPGLVAAGDGHHLELAVLAGDADRGDAEAGEVGDALGDQLEGVARRPVGPDRSDRLLLARFPRHGVAVPFPLGEAHVT